jgi:hypothetical protein
MLTELKRWVEVCKRCQHYKHQKGLAGAALPKDTPRTIPTRPWQDVYIDAVGPLAVGNGGFRFCLVAVDHFTRWVEVFPVRRLTSQVYVGWLQDLVSKKGPMRRRITSDRGSNFVGKLVEAYCKAVGVEKHHTTAWRPSGVSLVERYNGDLKDRMKAYTEEVQSMWPSAVADFAMAHNTTVHTSTGYTPFFLMHGWEAKVPYDLLVEAQREEENLDIARYADRMVVAVEDAWRAASENMGDVAARTSSYYAGGECC